VVPGVKKGLVFRVMQCGLQRPWVAIGEAPIREGATLSENLNFV
jgi:hypothetical protein